MIAIVHSIYSQSVHAPARDAGLMDNDAERYCILMYCFTRKVNCFTSKVNCFTPKVNCFTRKDKCFTCKTLDK